MTRIILRLMVQGVRDLSLNPLAQIFTLAAVTLVTFLSGLFLMALTTLNHQLGTVRGETAFQIYWERTADMKEVKNQWANFSNMPGYSHAVTYTPEQALKELGSRINKEKSDISQFPIVAAKNPLPATALVYFVPESTDVERWIDETETYLTHMPGVERVISTPLRDELGQAWRKVSQYVMWPSVIFLSFILALVVGNTIRLSLVARSHEVEILQIVGAYNWYIRLPLIIGGALQGLVGGLLALLILAFIHLQLKDVLNFPPLMMQVQFLPFSMCVALIFVPALMGVIASWLAVRD